MFCLFNMDINKIISRYPVGGQQAREPSSETMDYNYGTQTDVLL